MPSTPPLYYIIIMLYQLCEDVGSVKWVIHYSRTITKHGQNKSFAKKIVSSWNTAKIVLHAIRWLSKVLCPTLLLQFAQKISLSLSWRPLAWRNKTNQVSLYAKKHVLHTMRGTYQFCCFIPVSSWFANSV